MIINTTTLRQGLLRASSSRINSLGSAATPFSTAFLRCTEPSTSRQRGHSNSLTESYLPLLSATVNAAENPFALKSLSSGYQVADNHTKAKDGKCGTGKCGASKKKTEKAAEGKCGGEKAAEGKCSAEKAHEGKCGGEKAAEGKCSAEKAKEGKCGGEKK